jgi:hypothetical protein
MAKIIAQSFAAAPREAAGERRAFGWREMEPDLDAPPRHVFGHAPARRTRRPETASPVPGCSARQRRG